MLFLNTRIICPIGSSSLTLQGHCWGVETNTWTLHWYNELVHCFLLITLFCNLLSIGESYALYWSWSRHCNCCEKSLPCALKSCAGWQGKNQWHGKFTSAQSCGLNVVCYPGLCMDKRTWTITMIMSYISRNKIILKYVTYRSACNRNVARD